MANFVDRDEEQALALRTVKEWREHSRPVCLALSGPAGSGKTELAFQITRKLRDQFPGFVAICHIDLDDLRRDGAVSLNDALGELLRALDMEQEWLEGTFTARHRQYLAKTDGKRLIVVIDNARYGSEVLPLLPASSAAVVIVTSQGRLSDLDAGTAIELAVDPLDNADAMRLLEGITADPRLEAEPEAAAGLLRLCSGLPAAIRVAGQLLRRHHRRPLSRLLTDLTAEVRERGLPVVEKVWDAAYDDLGPDAACLYRLLGGFPGPSFTVDAATALLGRGPVTANDALEELEGAGLLEVGNERTRLPELLRAHASRRSRRDGAEEGLLDGKRRIIRWYLRQAQAADALAAGERMTFAERVPPIPGAPDVPLETKAQALQWLESERHTLYGCIAMAYALGLDSSAWALCEPLWTHYLDHPHYADALDGFRTGLAAAQRCGDVRAVARMRCQIARPCWEQGRFDEAERELDQALTASETMSGDNRKLRASVRESHGMLRAVQGDWEGAATEFSAALRIHQEIDNAYGVMLQTYRLGQAVAALGETERALTLLEQAHSMAGDDGRERLTARTGVALAGVLRRLARMDEAHELYTAALSSARERGSTFDQARILGELAELAAETGDTANARLHREMADALRDRGTGLT
ncbi:MAG TPA: NB-ARC domain-containing protein [Streptosporangiaceae bacterium]